MLATARASPAILFLLNLISPVSPAHPDRLTASRRVSVIGRDDGGPTEGGSVSVQADPGIEERVGDVYHDVGHDNCYRGKDYHREDEEEVTPDHRLDG